MSFSAMIFLADGLAPAVFVDCGAGAAAGGGVAGFAGV